MELVEFGPDDQERVAAFVDLSRTIDAADSPWEMPRSAYRQAMRMRHGWDGEPGRWFVAYDGAAPVGVASIDASEHDNLEMAWFSVRVAPGCRRRGHGTAILRALEERAEEMGRPLLGVDGWDSPATRGFAAARGYTLKSAEIRRVLAVAEAPDLRRVRDEACAHAQDYELVRIEGCSPADLLPGLVDLTAAINDAPFDDLEWEDEVYDVDRVRAYEQAQVESGFRLRRIVARHRAGGELAGHTVVVVDAHHPEVAVQHDTSVLRAHRGHRLGLLLKAEMLLWLADAEPQVTHVHTDNAESNRHMIAVNDRLAFRPAGRRLEFQRRLR